MRRFALLASCFAIPVALYAQTGVDGWGRVQQLPAGAHVRISASHGGGECLVQAVSAESVICQRGNGIRTVMRADVKTIKLSRRGRSAVEGLAFGGGIGAGIGAISGLAYNSSDRDQFFHTTAGNSAAVGAAVGFVVGGVAGSAISAGKDWFAGPVLYRR